MASRFSLISVSLTVLAAGSLLALDKVRTETNSDKASSKYHATGKGVIFAMIDRGIDWENKDFQNANGTTRIAYIFDLTDDTGAKASNNPYKKGTIYSAGDINKALQGGPAIPERDYIGHGTANTAIAVGNGANVAKYQGIAPEAAILVVKMFNEATPAFGETPAIPSSYTAKLIPTAVQFIVDKAKELKMPCVIVMDQGSIGGSTDGTSTIARLIDSTTGNQPGLIFIPGAGDDGGIANHAAGTVPANKGVTVKLKKGKAGTLILDFWYSGSDAFDVTIHTPDKTYGPFKAPSNNAADFQDKLGEVSYFHYGANTLKPDGAKNGKREITILMSDDSPTGSYSVTLAGRTVVNGHFDASMNPSDEWDDSKTNFFVDHVAPGSIADFGSAHNGITDTCYMVRTSWTDVDGIARSLNDQGKVGAIWKGSSVGPTLDGRLGIDVSAPAETIFTAYDPKSLWGQTRANEIQDGKGFYGAAGANSSSNPVVAGIIALMLQINPRLDAFTVKDILHKSARHDSFTGAVPNATWGYGKIDALAALTLMHNTPKPAIGSLVNGASFATGAVAPGEMFTIFGSNLGPSALTFHDDLSWDLRFIGAVNGTEVLFDGVPAPMVYTSAGQIAGVVPYAVAGKSTTKVQVLYEGVASDPVTMDVVEASPSLFLAPGFSKTQAAANNHDGVPNSPSNPESRGNVVVMFATGEGQTNPTGVDGALAVTTPFPKPVSPVTVTIGGISAAVQYYGAAPGELAGVMQLNVEIPASAPTGSAIPVSVKVGDIASPANATLSIR